MKSIDATVQKDRVDTTTETGSNRCPQCDSGETTVPVVTVEGTTLWWCTRENCSRATWTTRTERPAGLADTPAPERVLNRLIDAATYRENADLLVVAREASALYRAADIPVPNVDWAACERRVEADRSAELLAD